MSDTEEQQQPQQQEDVEKPTTPPAAEDDGTEGAETAAAAEAAEAAAKPDGDDEEGAPAAAAAAADVKEEEEAAAAPVEPEEEKEPVRPATPQRTVNLRAELEALKAKLDQRKADLAAAKDELAAKRTREEIHAEQTAVQKATADARDAAEAAEKSKAESENACNVARAVGARVKRYELFVGRVESWVNNDLKAEIEAGKKERSLNADRDTLEKLQKLKARRDEALASLADLVDERGRNGEILRGASTNAPAQSPSRTGRTQEQQSARTTTHRDPNSPTSAAADTARRGVLLSPGASRSGTVAPLPKQPSEAELASWDLEDYKQMNEGAHEQLVSIRDLRTSFIEERKARVAKNTVTKRKVEAELTDLRYQQRHAQQDLKAKKKRVAELEQHNAALASTLQYTQQSMKVAWAPVRESLLDRSARRSAVNTARSKHGHHTTQRGASPPAQEGGEEKHDDGQEDEPAAPPAAAAADDKQEDEAPATQDDGVVAAGGEEQKEEGKPAGTDETHAAAEAEQEEEKSAAAVNEEEKVTA